MPHDPSNAWEPDPRKMGNWRAMFEQDRGGKSNGAPPSAAQGEIAHEQSPDIDWLALDLSIYKPWVLQRGRSRPVMMLELRRFEQRSGMWMGWQLSYPTLIAAEYTGDRLFTLDFGTRQFVIEGQGLQEMARHLQQGSVTAIQEYSQSVWLQRGDGPVIASIKRLGGD